MENKEKDFLTNQYLQQFYNPESQTKNYQLEKFIQISECINTIKNGGELDDIINSVKYILNNIENLEFDDSIEIGFFILNFALEFENVELSAISLHVLGILIRNNSQKEYYEPIKQEFINKSIEKSKIIFSYCQGPLSPQVNDLIFSFILFSNEMLNFSLENGLIQLIVDRSSSYFEEGNLDQEVLYLELILNITKSLSCQKKLTPIIYNTISDIYNIASQTMSLNIPHLNDLLIQIYDAIFSTQPDSLSLKKYNSIFEPLFDNFLENYANTLNKNNNNESYLLNILLNFSKKLFANNILKKYPIYNFIIQYLQLSVEDIDNAPPDIIEKIKISWDIERNLIFQNPDEVKYSITNNISLNALKIWQEGTIEMKCYVTQFLSNILYCIYDQQIFKYAEETNLLETLLSFVEYLPFDYSEYIIKSVSFLLSNPKISTQNKEFLIQKAESSEVYNSLKNFIELYPDNDVHSEGTYIFEYFDFNCYEEEEKVDI